ncbi:MAG: ABC transporter permease, partial [Pseudomonadota bacterium]|nr:ABC transporter permease [Pseudomonadota bacterium]
MLTFIIRRLLITIPMMLVISFLVYLGLELTPGDAVSHMIDPEAAARMTEEQFAEMREALGLNKTFLERYWIWLTNVVQGNFGHSLSGGVAISTIVLDRLPATLELSVFALVFSTLIGCVLGTLSALRRGSGTDNALTVVGMLGVSIPEFFFG